MESGSYFLLYEVDWIDEASEIQANNLVRVNCYGAAKLNFQILEGINSQESILCEDVLRACIHSMIQKGNLPNNTEINIVENAQGVSVICFDTLFGYKVHFYENKEKDLSFKREVKFTKFDQI